MESKFSIIEQKLDEFIRKFYSNRVVVGSLLLVVTFSILSFCLPMIESFTFMMPSTKTFLFYFSMFLFASIFIFFILIPFLKILKVISFISYEEASKILSDYFSGSKDLLINILQLHKDSSENSELLVASINQKIELISPLNFSHAINYKRTSKFLAITFGITFLFLIMIFCFHKSYSEGVNRFLDYSTYYQPENPYSLSILNDSLSCANGDDFNLIIKIDGPSEVSDVFVNSGNLNLRMNCDSLNYFSCNLKHLSSDISFKIKYLDYSSDNFNISVYLKPEILNYTVKIIPPLYTNLPSEELQNTGDFTVPFGSDVIWNFNCANVDDFTFFIDSLSQSAQASSNSFTIKSRVLKSFDYYFSFNSEFIKNQNSEMFHVNQIPDYSPLISVISLVDSTALNSMFFNGQISDDFGFHSLRFCYYDSDNPSKISTKPIEISKSNNQSFQFYFDFSGLPNSVYYYFEVKDNDNISGFKSSKTPLQLFTIISPDEINQRVNNLKSSISDKINQADKLLDNLNRELNDFQKTVSSNKELSDWEKQSKLNSILENQNKLKSLLEQISQENQFKDSFNNQLNEQQTSDLLEKQKQLQDFWDKLMTDDIKELMDKISELSNSINEKSFRDDIKDLQFDFQQISEQLDRNNTLMKMFDVQNGIENLSKELKKMSDDAEKLSNSLSDKSKSNSDLTDLKQNFSELKSEFENKKTEYDNLQKSNNELLDNKLDIPDLNANFEDLMNKFEELSDEFNSSKEPNLSDATRETNKSDSSNDLKPNNETNSSTPNKQKLSKDLNEVSQDLDELSEHLNGLNMNEKQTNQENLNDIRQILDNLLTLSFHQESAMKQLKSSVKSLAIVIRQVIQSQNSIESDFSLVRDSIYSLAKREPNLGHSVYEKIDDINSYFIKINSFLASGNKSQTMLNQNFVLTNINDLSLIFNEVQDQMQQQSSTGSSTDQQSEQNSSKNKKQMQQRQQSMQNMSNQQKSLKQMLEQMYNQLKKGDNPNNQQLAKALKMSEMLQQQLQQMKNQFGNTPQQQQLLNQMSQMLEQNSRDISNRNISKQLIDRQNTIFNKLLDFENAEKSKDLDEKRESKQGLDFQNENNKDLNLKFKDFGTNEFLNYPSLDLNLFYQDKYNDYLLNIN